MSQSIERFTCPSCKSTNVTFDATNQTITCNICGVRCSIPASLITQDMTSPASGVSGTALPAPAIKTEEFGYRRVTREIFPHTHEEFKTVEKEIQDIKESVEKLDAKLEELRGILPKVVVLEEVSKEEARRRVEEYLREHQTADIEELMLKLKIPVEVLVEIIDELKQEGKVTAEEERETN